VRNAILLVALLALPVFAQQADVVQLFADEVETAQAIDASQRALDQEKELLRARIVRNHLEAPQTQKGGCVTGRALGHAMLVKPEWGCGQFVFSKDFRSIVPAANLPSYGSSPFEMINGVPTAIQPGEEEANQER
jgi:hypothetical protein